MLDAFWSLSTTRDFGLGLGPIPWNLILEYARWAGIDDDNEELFVTAIREMDAAYIDWHAKNKASDPEPDPPKRK